jgi:hypothetical protein
MITKNKEKGKEKQEMTKVATIDTRRVLSIVVIAAMVIATLLAAMIPTIVSAADNPADNEGTTGGSFTTNDSSSPPLVNSVTLTDNASVPATAMDPQTEYYVEVDVTDNQTLEHLTSVELTIWYDADADHTPVPTSVDNQTCAIITWTPANTWALTAMGAGNTWSITNGTTPTLINNTGTFIFHFTPGKVATENAGSDEWDITAVATDAASGTDSETQSALDMNWRGEINTVSASVDFGSVSLGAQQISGALAATYISNGNYSEQAKTDAQWVNGGYTIDLENSGAPGDNHFRLDVNDESNSAPETQLTNAYVDIDNNETITSEDGVTNGSIYLWLTLGESGIPSGEYTGDINFAISNR